MRNLMIAAALAVTALSNPAFAADIATLPCVREQTTPAAAKALNDWAKRIAQGEQAAVPADARAEIDAAGSRCATKHGWSTTATEAAKQYTIIGFGYEQLVAHAATKGIKIATVTGALESMSKADREKLLTSDTPTIQIYLKALSERGAVIETEEIGMIYGGLGAVVILRDQSRDLFAAS